MPEGTEASPPETRDRVTPSDDVGRAPVLAPEVLLPSPSESLTDWTVLIKAERRNWSVGHVPCCAECVFTFGARQEYVCGLCRTPAPEAIVFMLQATGVYGHMETHQRREVYLRDAQTLAIERRRKEHYLQDFYRAVGFYPL